MEYLTRNNRCLRSRKHPLSRRSWYPASHWGSSRASYCFFSLYWTPWSHRKICD